MESDRLLYDLAGVEIGAKLKMMRHVFITLTFVFAFGVLAQCRAGVGAQDTAALIDNAKEVVDKLAAENFCAVSERFESQLKLSLTAEKMQEAWAAFIAQAGTFKKQISAEAGRTQGGYALILVRCEFEKSTGTIQISFDPDKKIIGLWVVPGSGATVSHAQQAQPSHNGPAETDSRAAAKRMLDLVVAENFSQVWGMFNAQMKNGFSAGRLREIWGSVIQNVGPFKRLADSQYSRMEGHDVVVMRCEFERGYVQVRVAYDGEKKIAGLYFHPSM